MLMWTYESIKECVCDIFVCTWDYKSCGYINESISFNTKYSLAGVNLECISQQQNSQNIGQVPTEYI